MTTTTQTQTPGPVYGLNGSNLDRLLAETQTALETVHAALRAVRQVGPHPRDFIHDAGVYGHAYVQACETHHARMNDLDRVYEYLTNLATTMADQLEARR